MSRNIWRTDGRMNFPLDGLEYYLPLWHPELSGSPITAKIPLGGSVTAAVTGATHVPPTHRSFITDDFIDLGNDRFDALTEGTILIWARSPATNSAPGILGFDLNADNDRALFQLIDTGLYFRGRTGGVERLIVQGDTALANDTWYLCGFSSDTNGNSLSLNGVAESAPNYTAGTAATDFFFDNMATGTTFYSLGRFRASGSYNYGNILIGEVWIYSRVLSAEEIKHIYLATKWRYV